MAAGDSTLALEKAGEDLPGTQSPWCGRKRCETGAGNTRCWWRSSDGLLKAMMTIAYFDQLSQSRLS